MKSRTRSRFPRRNVAGSAATVLLLTLASPAFAGFRCMLDDGTTGGSSAAADFSVACGIVNNSFLSVVSTGAGSHSSAFGVGNDSPGNNSSAFGFNSLSRGLNSVAFGSWYDVNQDGLTGVDAFLFMLPDLDIDGDGTEDSYSELTTAWGQNTVAVGAASRAVGDFSSVVGFRNIANGVRSNAMGSGNTANGSGSSALGSGNATLGDDDAALGTGNNTGVTDFFGLSANNAALGVGNTASGGFATFIDSPRYSSAAVGAGNQATGGNSSALGVDNLASAINSTAIGYSSVASALDSTAIGSNSVADRANTLSVGAVGSERQIVNVAAAAQDTDAVNLSQLYPLATALGGGAIYAGGVFTAPTYGIQGNNYDNVGSAFAAVDGAIENINARIVAVGGVQGEQGESAYEVAVGNGFAGTESAWLDSLRGPSGPSGPTGPEGPAGGGPRSVVYDADDQAALTLGGAGGTRISNVADGVATTDAANVGQVRSGDAETLAAANAYADNTATETLTAANTYTDQRFAGITGLSDSFESFRNQTDRRFQQQDRRIDRLSAMGGAYAGMAMNTSGLAGRNRIGVGVGGQGGEQALAVGYQRAVGNRASVSIAGAFSGDEKSVSAGAGFSW